MSQHDMDVANGAGVVVRADINAALQALASLSSGASAPSPSFPCQLWADTATSRLKRRNAANSAWLDEGPLDAVLRDAALQGGFVADTGAANAYVCNFVPTITARSESTPLRFKVANANTTASTINDGVGVVALVGSAHAALQGGELIANGIAWIQWNASVGGGSYVLLFCTGAPQQVADATKAKHAVTAGQLVTQSMTAFTTAGTAPSFTLTPSPAITAYAAGQRFRVKFHAAGAGSDTLNVAALGTKTLKQYDSSGAKVAAVIASGQLTDVEYDGTDLVIIDQLPASGNVTAIQGASKNLKGSTTGLSAVVSYTLDEIIVASASNQYQTLRSISISPTFATAGADGIDVGAANSQTASTWYSVWVIWNGTTIAGLLSLSATSPTMPAGYTHKARVGWVRTDATGNKFPLGIVQAGRRVQYKIAAGSNLTVPPSLISGTQGSTSTPTWVAAAVGNFVPSTATAISVTLAQIGSSGGAMAAPNNAYGPYSGTTSPPPLASSVTSGSTTVTGLFLLESTNVYYAAASASNSLICNGWEDNL